MRGLWERKGSYYAQLDANNGKQYKYPLHNAATVPQAITETQVLKKLQREGKLAPPTEMRLGKKEYTKEGTNGRRLGEAIAEYRCSGMKPLNAWMMPRGRITPNGGKARKAARCAVAQSISTWARFKSVASAAVRER